MIQNIYKCVCPWARCCGNCILIFLALSIFDGVIIMDKSPNQANLPKGPGKRRYDWASVTWNQWRSLHELPKHSIFDALTAYQAFPNAMPSESKELDELEKEQEGFQRHCISGRPPSELRAPLELYQRLSYDNTQARTLPWLNYIICCGDCITDQVVSIIQRCLRARDDKKAKHGRGPVWGWHETFQIGHWYDRHRTGMSSLLIHAQGVLQPVSNRARPKYHLVSRQAQRSQHVRPPDAGVGHHLCNRLCQKRQRRRRSSGDCEVACAGLEGSSVRRGPLDSDQIQSRVLHK